MNAETIRLYRQGKWPEALAAAEAAYERAMTDLGEEHPQTLTSLNNLAELYQATGRYGEAESLYARALEVSRRVLGEEHPDTLTSLNNLAVLQIAQGRPVAAAATLGESVRASRVWAELEADAASGAERRQAALARGGTADLLALALAAHAPSAETAALAALVVLNRKGLLGEREAELLRLTRAATGAEVREIAARYLAARRDLAAAYRQVAAPTPGGDAQAAQWIFAAASERVDALERELALASPGYRAMRGAREVEVADVQAALPEGSTLIEYAIFTPYDFAGSAWGEPPDDLFENAGLHGNRRERAPALAKSIARSNGR